MSFRPRLLLLFLAVCLGLGTALSCARPRPRATMHSLRAANETFLRFLRWSVLRDASQIVRPETRDAWLDGALQARDDDNLKVTEYEVEDLQVAKGGAAQSAVRLIWHRLPSVTTRTDLVKITWIERGGVWFISEIEGGPLPLAAPPAAAPADAALPAAP